MEDLVNEEPEVAPAQESGPTRVRAVGFCRGPATTPPGVTFQITSSQDTDLRAVTIPYGRYGTPGALPYEQPSVFFDVTLEPPERDSYARVVQVHSCRPRTRILEREVLIQHTCRILKAPPSQRDMNSVVRDHCERALPERVTSFDDYAPARFGRLDWLHNRVHQFVRAALLPVESAFWPLLSFFPGDWLLRFGEPQLAAMLGLLSRRPWAFFFWHTAVGILRSLTQTSASSKPLFGEVALRELRMRDNLRWINFTKTRERLVAETETYASFDAACPLLSYAQIQLAVAKFEGSVLVPVEPAARWSFLRDAMQLYLLGELDVWRQGVSIANKVDGYYRRQLLPDVTCHANLVAVLTGENVGASAEALDAERAGVVRSDRHDAELDLVGALHGRVSHLRVIHCNMYDGLFAKRLKAEVLDPASSSSCLLVTLNQAFKARLGSMLEGTSTKVYALQEAIEQCRKLKNTGADSESEQTAALGRRLLVVDRVHRMGSRALADLLLAMPETGELDLCAIGDMFEHGAQPAQGGGNLLVALSRLVAGTSGYKTWGCAAQGKTPPELLRALTKQELGINHIGHQLAINQFSALADATQFELDDSNGWNKIGKQRDTFAKQLKEAKRGSSVRIFCNSDQLRNVLLDKLCGVPAAQRNFCFRIHHSYVHVLEPDVWGVLEQAAQYAQGVRGVHQQNKQVDLRHDQYSVWVQGANYDTRRVTLEHAEVCLISQYTGPVVGYSMIFLDRWADRRDILGLLKYCGDGLRVYMLKGEISVDSVMRRAVPSEGYSDLENKLDCVKA